MCVCVCVCVNIRAFNKCTGRLSVVILEPIIQSEVSQKETEISYINTCMESRKMVLMNYLQGSNGDSDIANRLVDTGQDGEGGTNWESGSEAYTLPHIESDSQWEFAVWCRELKSCAPYNREGWDGVGSGSKVPEGGDIQILMADSCWLFDRNWYNIVKQLSSN